jgi:hypothetical protein
MQHIGFLGNVFNLGRSPKEDGYNNLVKIIIRIIKINIIRKHLNLKNR